MAEIITVLIKGVLFAAAILQLILIASVIGVPGTNAGKQRKAPQERIMRGIAAAVGLMLYLGSRALGISIPELAYQAMSPSFPIRVALGGVLFPSIVGLLVSWFVIRHISGHDPEKDAVAMRVLTMLMALVFFIYGDMLIYTYSKGGNSLQFLTNIVFVLSALLYAIFKYHPHVAEVRETGR